MHSWYFNYVKAQFRIDEEYGVAVFYPCLKRMDVHFVTEVISHGIPRDEMLGYMEELSCFTTMDSLNPGAMSRAHRSKGVLCAYFFIVYFSLC
jgi:hypothetical protein